MPEPLIEINQILKAGRIGEQVLEATDQLGRVLGGRQADRGRAYVVCNTWQRRFELALRSEIPDWSGLAGFRCIPDFVIPLESLNDEKKLEGKYFPPKSVRSTKADCPRDIENYDQCWDAYTQYFDEKRNLHSGKFQLKGPAEKHFLEKMFAFDSVLGGQAGNILWLWQSIGAACVGYVPYIAKPLTDLCSGTPELNDLHLLSIDDRRVESNPLSELKKDPGVRLASSRRKAGAPSSGSIIMFKQKRRLIYQFQGFRDLNMETASAMPWECVQFFYGGKPLLDQPLERMSPEDVTWPNTPLFCENRIERLKGIKTLCIHLADDEQMQAVAGNADFAVFGGIDAVFFDKWLTRHSSLQAKLLGILKRQLGVLADNGVRIGCEISGFPHRDYALLLKDLCRSGLVAAIGINGVDELPYVVGEKMIAENRLYEFWLDTGSAHPDLQAETSALDRQTDHFEYVTFLRARHLARVLDVRTLYVHTMTLDFIFRKNADPGSLLRAQLGSMMAKGLVIAALLRRSHGDKWFDELDRKMTPAIKPAAMATLGRFAFDFCRYENFPEAEERLLRSGFWLAPTTDEYSLAVAPVMWPHQEHLAEDFNATGSGDMTFGAFFFLGGV